MLFVSQEERRASDTVLFTSENNDIANQSIDTSFFTSEKNRMANQLASLAPFGPPSPWNFCSQWGGGVMDTFWNYSIQKKCSLLIILMIVDKFATQICISRQNLCLIIATQFSSVYNRLRRLSSMSSGLSVFFFNDFHFLFLFFLFCLPDYL